MKHAITGKTIIPKVMVNDRWVYIAEKIRVNGIWVKMWYLTTTSYIDIPHGLTNIDDTSTVYITINEQIIA